MCCDIVTLATTANHSLLGCLEGMLRLLTDHRLLNLQKHASTRLLGHGVRYPAVALSCLNGPSLKGYMNGLFLIKHYVLSSKTYLRLSATD
jgi:hypothetical protein